MTESLHLYAQNNKVYWRILKPQQQTSTVFGAFDVDPKNEKSINEILVAWHLLVERTVLGVNRYGTNLNIVFSQAQSKQLLGGDSVIKDSVAMAAVVAFRVRFGDAVVDLSQKDSLFDLDVPSTPLPNVRPEVNVYNESCGATINITFHALERWKERSKTKTYTKALRSLLDMAKTNTFYEIKLNDRIAYNKKMRYEQEASHYAVDIHQGVRFVCVDRPLGEKTVLTVYFAPPLNC
jgi:hypothetical protein